MMKKSALNETAGLWLGEEETGLELESTLIRQAMTKKQEDKEPVVMY